MATRPQRALTAEQELRANFLEIFLQRANPGSTIDVLYQVDAVTKFIMTSEIVGHSPGNDPDDAQVSRKPVNSAARTR